MKPNSPTAAESAVIPDVGVQTVKGQKAGSKLEALIASVLDAMRFEYAYQVPFMGGSRVAGGQTIDFLIYKAPKPIPVYAQGGYWHSARKDPKSAFKLSQVEIMTKGLWDKPVELWESECTTFEATRSAVLRKIGLP